MRLMILAFACGVILVQQLAALPPSAWSTVAAAGACVIGGASLLGLRPGRARAFILLLAAASLGASFAALRAEHRLASALPSEWEGRDVSVVGVIAEMAQPFARGERFGPYRVGVMIETPAAVFMSGELAGEVDFFSIGTNDLTQYLLAMDRQNPNLAPFCDPHHPAVLRAIRQTVERAHQAGCTVGICGELAADEALTEAFLRLGVDELSVAPSRILPLREKIRSLTLG